MTFLSMSLVVLCSLLLGYITFIISPVHGREELNNELLKQSEMDTKLNRAEIQNELLALIMGESTGDDVAEVMGKGRTRSRSRSPAARTGIDPRSKAIRKRGRSRSPAPSRSPPRSRQGTPSRSGQGKRQRTRNVFNSRTSRLVCRTGNPLSSYTEGVPRELERDVQRFLEGRPRNEDCGGGISLVELMQLANSMLSSPVFNVRGGKSYAYVDPNQCRCGGGFYESSSRGKCRHNLAGYRNYMDSEMYILDDCPNVREYWSGWTPCYFCEQSLMKWKRQTNRGTVRIHVGKMYNWGNKRSTPECLALMIKQGFQLEPWSWDMFERQTRFSRRNPCQHLLDLIQMCSEFDAAQTAIEREINRARLLANRYTERELDILCLV